MAIKAAVIAAHLSEAGFANKSAGRATCPECGPDRKNKTDRSLSVRMDDGTAVYKCHHCDAQGAVKISNEPWDRDDDSFEAREASYNTMSSRVPLGVVPHRTITQTEKAWPTITGATPEPRASAKLNANAKKIEWEKPKVKELDPKEFGDPLSDAQLRYLREERGMSSDTVEKFGLVSSQQFVRGRGKVDCIGFPYVNADGSTAVKWRDGLKNFTQTGSAQSLWRIDSFLGGDMIITEGEFDAMAFNECGLDAYSVPNGAPSAPSISDDSGKTKYKYLWDARDKINLSSRVIIAGDNDEAGQILPEEIARRIGKAKCWRMTYPADCKDANDVLLKHGPERLKELLTEVTPWPIGGLRDASEYEEESLRIFNDGQAKGISVMAGDIATYYRPSPGTLTIATGTPGSGKSTFLTWLSVELARQEGWTTAVFAAETSPAIHINQLAALYTGKPFEGPDKMSKEERAKAGVWIKERYVFLDESETGIKSIIERAQGAVLRYGVRILMIDPYNFITHERVNDGDNGQAGIVELLTSLKRFAVTHDVAVWLVCHPTKMYRDHSGKAPIPGGYDISGSAHFFNIADNGITISRDNDRPNISTLTSWKARFSWLGSLGKCDLAYDPTSGNFSTLKEWGGNPEDWRLKRG